MAAMDPLLLAASFSGSWQALGFLLDGGDATERSTDAVPTQSFLELLQHGATSDPDKGNMIMAMPQQATNSDAAVSTMSLLEGVTAEGDTALHVVATNGDGESYLRSADIICRKATHLLFRPNRNGDTSLHCAARAGRSRMVSQLVAFARGCEDGAGERMRELLRMENGSKETALHEAVLIGSIHIVELLMAADPELAYFPKDGGTSPLYLAVLHDQADIAHTLHQKSGGYLSYSGPDGQNALHAAALRSQAMTEMLLEFNIGLTAQKDRNGSTPLHFATSILHPRGVHFWIFRPWYVWFHGFWHSSMPFYPVLQVIFHPWFPWNHGVWHSGMPFDALLQANPTPMYQSDDQGLFPIHVAAFTGVNKAIVKFLEKCPTIAVCAISKGELSSMSLSKRRSGT
ncbi:espin-like protein isoform X1 [Brachypodium distachyon]|uniref:espin-like protein isoform X1 n=1 Tax=Brachypodium distachyon TaxID=15368 RepID=UPI00071CE5E6|nr:espin-like protein isoform X1 [Brachypodium distachyon]XP_014757696.1 espin-like protein isoform X1 [Brachypodium distachyon]|eukprot:XP_014757694.1 espin-like protein isoform X1 [Brachypodium distachyon]